MIYLWLVLGIFGYVAVGSFTYGVIMRFSKDEELAIAGVVFLPLTLVGAVGVKILCALYSLLELIGVIRFFRWLERLGRGGDET